MGAGYQSPPVALEVRTSAVLKAISIGPVLTVLAGRPAVVLFGRGDTLQLSLTGRFEDGVDRLIPTSEVTWSRRIPVPRRSTPTAS